MSYSVVSCLYVNFSGLIISVGEERAHFSRKLASFDVQTRDNIRRYQCDNPIISTIGRLIIISFSHAVKGMKQKHANVEYCVEIFQTDDVTLVELFLNDRTIGGL